MMMLTMKIAPPNTGRAAFDVSAQSTFGTSSSSARVRAHALSRARPVLVERHVLRARQLSTISHRRWLTPAACVAPDGEKSASAHVTHHSPRAQHEARWNLRLRELREFKDEHGHLVVPATSEFRPLHNWIYQQRKMRREGNLLDTRFRPLDEIGLEWEPPRGRKKGTGEPRPQVFHDQWVAMFDWLRSFHRENGHCKVPKTQNVKLHAWVHEQRRKHRRDELDEKRAEMLRGIGFELASRGKATWEERFDELHDFQKAHGHCNVPATWRHNKRLGSWVYRQRKSFRAGTLPEDRVNALKELGLDWEPKASLLKASKKAFHVRQTVSPWAVRNTGNASRAGIDAAVQWMGCDDDELDREAKRGDYPRTAVVNGWGKASSAYEEKQQFVFDRIDGWWRGSAVAAANFSARRRVRAMRYNYAVKAKERTIKPDIVLEVDEGPYGIWGLVIEVDEFAHKRYSWRNEEERMQELQAALGVPLKIVRFNPDPTTANESNLDERTDMLLKHVVENVLLTAPVRDLEVEYFLYD